MSKEWKQISYTDRLTGKITGVEIVPLDDLLHSGIAPGLLHRRPHA